MDFRRLVLGYIDDEFCERITYGKRNEKGDRRIALDEFYQIDTLWHLSGLKISLASSTSKKTKKKVPGATDDSPTGPTLQRLGLLRNAGMALHRKSQLRIERRAI